MVDVDDVEDHDGVGQQQDSHTMVVTGRSRVSLVMMDCHSMVSERKLGSSLGSRCCCDGVRNGQQMHPHSMILVVKVADDIVESLECSPSHEIQNNFSGLEEEAEYELRLRAMNR